MKPNKHLSIVVTLCCFAVCMMVGSAFAQVATANVVGTVTDSSGAVVPGATVTIQNTGTAETHSVQSSQSGDFTFNFLQPGIYSVTIEAPGFHAFKVQAMTLAAGDRTRSDAKLQVGDTSQTIQVAATTSVMQTDASTITNVVPPVIVQDVPLNGRNYVSLVQHTAGITVGGANSTTSGTRPDDRRQTNSASANGQTTNGNNNMVDGMDNNERNAGLIILRPSIDSIQEVRVDTSNMTADTGRTLGAAINVITKAGTNGLHGTFFEFFRNDVLDANDYFAKRAHLPRYEYRQNQFGGSVSGSIRKNKTFFFADIEELRIVQGQPTGLLTIPTLFELQNPGNFSDQLVTNANNVPDPNNPGKFLPVGAPGPIIPISQQDPVAQKLWALFPAPNVAGAGTVNNYSNSPNKTYNATTVDARLDNHFRNGDSAFVRYSWQPVSSFTPGYLPEVNGIQAGGGSYPGPNETTSQGVQLHYVHTFSSNLVAEAGLGFSRINLASLPLNYGNNVDTALGIPNGNTDPHSSGLSPIVISGIASGLGDANYIPILDIENVFQENGAVTYTRGAHNIKIGASLIRRQMNFNQYPYAKGEFDFQNGSTLASEVALLQGNPTTIHRGNPQPALFGIRMWEPSAYVQDDWRATPRLTVNLGLRWDFYSPQIEVNNHRSNFDLNTLSLIVATPNDRAAGVKPTYTNFAPRFGFAESLGHNMVLRGAFGIVFSPREATFAITPLNQPYYFLVACNPGSTNSGLKCPAGIGKLSNGPQIPTFGSINPLQGAVYGRSLNYPTSYMEQANLTLQKQFGQTVLTATYVGEFGRRLNSTVNADNPDPAPGPLPAYRYGSQFPLVSAFNLYYDVGNSNYHAGQFSVERRYSHGLTLNANYTWAHGLSTSPGTLYGAQWNHYYYGSYGTSSTFNLLAAYDLPFFNNATGIKKAAFAGWAIQATAFWNSGSYFTVSNTAHNPALFNIPGQTSDRPNRRPGVGIKANRSRTQWFNLAAFAEQPQGMVGNEGTNILQAPPNRQLDSSISKGFRIGDRLDLQFRAEAFNVTNTENFAAPNSGIASWHTDTNTPNAAVGAVGQLTSTQLGFSPRVYQFALKGSF